MQKWIILIVVFIIVVLSIFIVSNVSVETEYTPETEIEDVELRKTIVTLYFKNKETGELAKETRLIDSKDLLRDPYSSILSLLLQGPENSNYERVIPEGVTIVDTKFENGCVIVKFSKELFENLDDSKRNDITISVSSTLTQLTEVTAVRVLIEGEENTETNTQTNEVSNETVNETTNEIANNVTNENS